MEIPDDRSSSLFGHRLPVRVITGAPGPFSGTQEMYEPSEHSSGASEFDYRVDRFDNGIYHLEISYHVLKLS